MITDDVYNAGIMGTDSLASIITAAYFVDDEYFSLMKLVMLNLELETR